MSHNPTNCPVCSHRWPDHRAGCDLSVSGCPQPDEDGQYPLQECSDWLKRRQMERAEALKSRPDWPIQPIAVVSGFDGTFDINRTGTGSLLENFRIERTYGPRIVQPVVNPDDPNDHPPTTHQTCRVEP